MMVVRARDRADMYKNSDPKLSLTRNWALKWQNSCWSQSGLEHLSLKVQNVKFELDGRFSTYMSQR